MFADPVGTLPLGHQCTLTVEALAPSDADPIDPPSGMREDFWVTYFMDTPPSVVHFGSTGPIGTVTQFLLFFSENVILGAGAITITGCGGGYSSVAASAIGNVDYRGLQRQRRETCTLTVHRELVTGSSNQIPLADYVASFVIPE